MTRMIEKQLRRPLEGVLVTEVVPTSPAERAGLRASQLRGDGSALLEDLITHVGDTPVRQVEDLLCAIEERQAGEVVEIRVLRQCDPSRAQILRVQLTSRDELKAARPPVSLFGRR